MNSIKSILLHKWENSTSSISNHQESRLTRLANGRVKILLLVWENPKFVNFPSYSKWAHVPSHRCQKQLPIIEPLTTILQCGDNYKSGQHDMPPVYKRIKMLLNVAYLGIALACQGLYLIDGPCLATLTSFWRYLMANFSLARSLPLCSSIRLLSSR